MELLTPAYMSSFSCLGSECEDTCCRGWNVPVDKAAYKRIQSAMGESGKAAFDEVFVPRVPPAADAHFARIDMSKTGECPVMDTAGWCTLHADFGGDVLGDVCAMFPREVVQVADRVELYGSMGCPEVARRCLLSPNGLDLEEHDLSLLPRPRAEKLSLDLEDPYQAALDDVRQAMVTLLLGIDGAPGWLRQLLPHWLAHKTRGFLHRGAQPDCMERFVGVWQALIRPATLDQIHERVGAMDPHSEGTLDLVTRLLIERSQSATRLAFRRLIGGAVDSYSTEAGSDADGNVDSQRLAVAWERRRAILQDAPYASRLDDILARYAANYWLSSKYMFSPDLVVHGLPLMTTLAVVRFLFLGDDKVVAQLPQPEATADLDASVIRIVTAVSRDIAHADRFVQRSRDLMVGQGRDNLAWAITLCRF